MREYDCIMPYFRVLNMPGQRFKESPVLNMPVFGI